MSFATLKKENWSYGVPVWQTMHETAQGGFTLDRSVIPGLADGTILKAGTPFGYDEATRLAKPIITAEIQANAGSTATAYRLKKGHNVKVGDKVALTVGGASYTVSAITTADANYDEITVTTTLGAATAGDSLFVSTASGATAGAYAATPRGLLYEDTEVQTGEGIAIVLRGTVYERRIPRVPTAIKTALPNIIFSQSF